MRCASHRHVRSLDAKTFRLQPLDERDERFVVGALDGYDVGIGAAVRRIPEFLCSSAVPEIEKQVQTVAHHDRDTRGAEKVCQVKNVRQMRDDKAVEFCREERLTKLGVTSRQNVARRKMHRKILDRLFLAVGMNGVEKSLELGKCR